jgi:hypothetical protein
MYNAAVILKPFCVEAKLLFNAMVQPPDLRRKNAINDFIRGDKFDGNWSITNAIWFPASHNQQAANLNWKNPGTFTLVPVNNPVWDYRGYTGGSPAYLTTGGYSNAYTGTNYIIGSGSIGCYIASNQQSGAVCGIANDTINPRNIANNFIGRIGNGGTTKNIVGGQLDARGYNVTYVNDLTTIYAVKNGVIIGGVAHVANAIGAAQPFILAINSAGTPQNFFAGTVSYVDYSSGAINFAKRNLRIQELIFQFGVA